MECWEREDAETVLQLTVSIFIRWRVAVCLSCLFPVQQQRWEGGWSPETRGCSCAAAIPASRADICLHAGRGVTQRDAALRECIRAGQCPAAAAVLQDNRFNFLPVSHEPSAGGSVSSQLPEHLRQLPTDVGALRSRTGCRTFTHLWSDPDPPLDAADPSAPNLTQGLSRYVQQMAPIPLAATLKATW